MNDTFRLGRIAGIPIGVNWTWLFVFVLFVSSLSSSVFPASNPGLGSATYAAMGIAAALLFFGSLLLHELGHALVARREGVEIEGITLWLFGGVARLRSPFPSAGAEFRIAVAGPIVTALLSGGFVALAVLARFGPAVDGVLAWLGYINVFLLAFNLLPALPLDGGRVFRAALWRLKGDFGFATRIAAAVGRIFGLAFVALGGYAFFFTGSRVDGLWLALLGWFLFNAADRERRALRPTDLASRREPLSR